MSTNPVNLPSPQQTLPPSAHASSARQITTRALTRAEETINGIRSTNDGTFHLFWTKHTLCYPSNDRNKYVSLNLFNWILSADVTEDGQTLLVCDGMNEFSLSDYSRVEIYTHRVGTNVVIQKQFQCSPPPLLDLHFISTRILSNGASFTVLCQDSVINPISNSLFVCPLEPTGNRRTYLHSIQPNPYFSGDCVLCTQGESSQSTLFFCDLKIPHVTYPFYSEGAGADKIQQFALSQDQSTVTLLAGNTIHVWKHTGSWQKTACFTHSLFPESIMISLSPLGKTLILNRQVTDQESKSVAVNIETKKEKILNLPIERIKFSANEMVAVYAQSSKELCIKRCNDSLTARLPEAINHFCFASNNAVLACSDHTLYEVTL